MNKKAKGTLACVLCLVLTSWLWFLLFMAAPVSSGLGGALMGVLSMLPYHKINPDDRSAYPYVLCAMLIFFETVAAQIIAIAIGAAMLNFDFGAILVNPEIWLAIMPGFVLAVICYVVYALMIRKRNIRAGRKRTDAPPPNNASDVGDNAADGTERDGISDGGPKKE